MMVERTSFGFSAENPTGERSGGSRGADCEKLRPCIQIGPGQTAVLAEVDGPGALTHIWMTGYTGHSFILRIFWEGEKTPAVEAPISAFFGMAYDENWADRDGRYPCYQSAVLSIAPGRGLNSYFVMPFLRHCLVTLENRGSREETLFYMIEGVRGEGALSGLNGLYGGTMVRKERAGISMPLTDRSIRSPAEGRTRHSTSATRRGVLPA